MERQHRLSLALLSMAIVAAATSGAVAMPRRWVGDTIAVSSGTCFTGCPLRHVAIRPNGRVTIGVGGRETVRYVDPAFYRELAASLRPYRPTTGTVSQTVCARQDAGEMRYSITWRTTGRLTRLDHDFGCSSPRNAVLNAILVGTTARLTVEEAITRTPLELKSTPLPKPHIFYF